MFPQTSFQEDTEAISLRVLRECFAEHKSGACFTYIPLRGNRGGATSKVFFAPFHAIGVNMRLSFTKESAEKAASHVPTFCFAEVDILLCKSRHSASQKQTALVKLSCKIPPSIFSEIFRVGI